MDYQGFRQKKGGPTGNLRGPQEDIYESSEEENEEKLEPSESLNSGSEQAGK